MLIDRAVACFLRHNTWHECIMQYLFLLFQRLFLSDFMSHAADSGADARRNRGDTERDTGETRRTDEIAKEKIGRRSNKKSGGGNIDFSREDRKYIFLFSVCSWCPNSHKEIKSAVKHLTKESLCSNICSVSVEPSAGGSKSFQRGQVIRSRMRQAKLDLTCCFGRILSKRTTTNDTPSERSGGSFCRPDGK